MFSPKYSIKLNKTKVKIRPICVQTVKYWQQFSCKSKSKMHWINWHQDLVKCSVWHFMGDPRFLRRRAWFATFVVQACVESRGDSWCSRRCISRLQQLHSAQITIRSIIRSSCAWFVPTVSTPPQTYSNGNDIAGTLNFIGDFTN